MRNVLVGIFAHPDDETFGPAGSLLKAAADGVEIHLICLTNGDAGVNFGQLKDLGAVRQAEWRAAGEALGATGLYPLNYNDGQLCHRLYPEIGKQLRRILDYIVAGNEPIKLRFMTFDQNGLTGHLDHIAASYLTTKLFCELKQTPPAHVEVVEIAYYCLCSKQAPTSGDWPDYYSPLGRPDDYINRREEIRQLLPRKFEIMRLHVTQRDDAERIMQLGEDALAYDCFFVVKA